MKVIGITGGIGSGKSFVASIFSQLGIPVYDADSHAKPFMTTDPSIIKGLTENFGKTIYESNGALNKKLLSDLIFADENARLKVNSIVHPAVAIHFETWKDQHFRKPYVIKESAILFEANADKGIDFSICVTAPIDLRKERIKARDHSTNDKIQSIINNQMEEGERNSKCNFVVVNDNITPLLPQIIELNKLFSKPSKNKKATLVEQPFYLT